MTKDKMRDEFEREYGVQWDSDSYSLVQSNFCKGYQAGFQSERETNTGIIISMRDSLSDLVSYGCACDTQGNQEAYDNAVNVLINANKMINNKDEWR